MRYSLGTNVLSDLVRNAQGRMMRQIAFRCFLFG